MHPTSSLAGTMANIQTLLVENDFTQLEVALYSCVQLTELLPTLEKIQSDGKPLSNTDLKEFENTLAIVGGMFTSFLEHYLEKDAAEVKPTPDDAAPDKPTFEDTVN